MIGPADVGGVHIKYLYHCPRQLWLYLRGVRPEHLDPLVQRGEAVHETSYRRAAPIDLGAARLDDLDGQAWVHEIKSGSRPTGGDRAQVIHYCHRLHEVGVAARGGVLHYPATRRTVRVAYDEAARAQATADIAAAVEVAGLAAAPERLPRARCRGCSFIDYCWSGG